MGLLKEFLSNKIQIEDLQPGDHIYSWRGLLYAHHGIYVGDGQVIHFRGASREAAEVSGVDKMIEKAKRKVLRASMRSNSSASITCEKCNIHADPRGVSKSCLGCFLEGGHLYRCKYEMNSIVQRLRRGGTCTGETASPVETIVHRAEYLLGQEVGFGKYDLFKRNCEDFALYCRVGVIGVGQGASGQVARLKKTMPRVKEVEVEDLVAELRAQSSRSSRPSTSSYFR